MPGESRFSRLFGQIGWSLRQRGLLNTLRTVASRVLRRGAASGPPTHPFDLEHGTDTSGLIGSRDLRSGHAHDVYSTAYFGVPPSRLRHAIQRWQDETGVGDRSAFAFFDAGCGKGRALLVASTLGFREVAGAELNAGLADVARKNIELWRQKHPDAAATHVVTADVTETELPAGPLLVYTYNPFGAPVLRKLLAHLAASRGESTAPLYMLYLYPEHTAVFDEFAQFRRIWSGMVPLEQGEPLDGVSSFEDPCELYELRSKRA